MTCDLDLRQGEKHKFNFDVTDDDGNAFNLSGKEVTLKVYPDRYKNTTVLSKSATDGDSNGNVDFEISASEADLEQRTYYYIVRIVDDDYIAGQGRFVVKRSQ